MIESELYKARNYDRGMRLLERSKLFRLRRRVASEIRGRTLEIGAGTGANVVAYQPGVEVTAIDIRPESLSVARNKARPRRDLEYTISCADAQDLPFPDAAFDTVYGTLVFCSIAEPEQALAEIRRVLRPGGRLLLLEHVRGQTAISRKLTDWLHPLWFALQGACHLNRETAATVAGAGFRIDETTTHSYGLMQVILATLSD